MAINHFVTDTDAEVQAVKDYVEEQGAEAICRSTGSWARKAAELATRSPNCGCGERNFAPIYPDDMPLFEKIETIAKRIYRAMR